MEALAQPAQRKARGAPQPERDPAERQADAIGKRIAAELPSSGLSAGALDLGIQAVGERILGVSLADTELHTDARAQEKASEDRALAVTESSHISFGAQQLGNDARGRELLGHELVHVAQQRKRGTRGRQRQAAMTKAGPSVADAIESGVSSIDDGGKESGKTDPLWNPRVIAALPVEVDDVKVARTAAFSAVKERERLRQGTLRVLRSKGATAAKATWPGMSAQDRATQAKRAGAYKSATESVEKLPALSPSIVGDVWSAAQLRTAGEQESTRSKEVAGLRGAAHDDVTLLASKMSELARSLETYAQKSITLTNALTSKGIYNEWGGEVASTQDLLQQQSTGRQFPFQQPFTRKAYDDSKKALEAFMKQTHQGTVTMPDGKPMRAAYSASRGLLQVRLDVAFNWVEDQEVELRPVPQRPGEPWKLESTKKTLPWTPAMKEEYIARFRAAALAWHSASTGITLHCQKDWWEALNASVELVVNILENPVGNATVIEARSGFSRANAGSIPYGSGEQTVAHEVGHLVGYGDEYIEPDPKISSEEEAKLNSDCAREYPRGETDPKYRSCMTRRRADLIQSKKREQEGTKASHSRLVEQEFGVEVRRGRVGAESIMAGGSQILPMHYVTFLHAIRQITGVPEWSTGSRTPRPVPPDEAGDSK
jgi:hypothetical protein